MQQEAQVGAPCCTHLGQVNLTVFETIAWAGGCVETVTVVPRAVPREPARAVSSTAWTAASSSPTAAVTGVPSAAAPSVAMVTVKVT